MAPSPLLVRPGGLPLLHVLLVPPLAPLLLPLILFLLPPRLRRACGGLLPLPVAVLLRWRQLAPRCAARLGLRDGPAPRPLRLLPLLLRLLLLLARMLRWRPPAALRGLACGMGRPHAPCSCPCCFACDCCCCCCWPACCAGDLPLSSAALSASSSTGVSAPMPPLPHACSAVGDVRPPPKSNPAKARPAQQARAQTGEA